MVLEVVEAGMIGASWTSLTSLNNLEIQIIATPGHVSAWSTLLNCILAAIFQNTLHGPEVQDA